MEINDNYLSVNLLDSEKVVIYEKWIPETENNIECKKCKENNSDNDNENNYEERSYRKICLLTEDGNRYHKYCGFNKFTQETFPLPSENDGWVSTFETLKNKKDSNEHEEKMIKREKKMINDHICDPTSQIFDPKLASNINKPQDCKIYKTLDNYDIGFIVHINESEDEVYVYGTTTDVIVDDYDDETILFTNKIVTYKPLEIFIGKSPINEMTLFSGGHGDKWDGNSILLRIGTYDEFRYVHIGIDIFEFVVNEQITKYVSSVGNNCVPYPYAESQNFCYCMSDKLKTPIIDHSNREKVGYVSYMEKAFYEKMEIVTISSRGSTNTRYEESPEEQTFTFRFKKPIQVCLMKNTCDNDALPAVQSITKKLN